MPYRHGYDRGYGYDRGFRGGHYRGAGGGPRGYDRGSVRYDRGYGGAPARPEYRPPVPFPFVPFGWDPMMGPMMGPMAWPMLPYGAEGMPAPGPRYDRGYQVPPRRSPAYGRGGDRALRAWADRYGYDVEFSIPPRPRPRRY